LAITVLHYLVAAQPRSALRGEICFLVWLRRASLFKNHDLIAFRIVDADLIGLVRSGNVDSPFDEALADGREVIYLYAEILNPVPIETSFFGQHESDGSIA
jgi:hypothetical protein